LTGITGADASGFVYYDMQTGGNGAGWSIGPSWGMNCSGEAFVGFTVPDVALRGSTINLNGSVWIVNATCMVDPLTLDFVGLTVGVGGGLPVGLSVSYSTTFSKALPSFENTWTPSNYDWFQGP
jgi:hypothetical protein